MRTKHGSEPEAEQSNVYARPKGFDGKNRSADVKLSRQDCWGGEETTPRRQEDGMKQLIRHTLTPLFITVLWLAGAARAQSETIVKVHVPFEFSVGSKTLPEGDYSIVQPLQHYLELRDSRNHVIASTFTHAVQASSVQPDAKLKFYTVDGQYFLSEVWQGQNSIGQQLARQKSAVAVARRDSTETSGATTGSQP